MGKLTGQVAFITGARADDPPQAFFGAQTAEALAKNTASNSGSFS